MSELLRIDRPAPGVLRILINRPDKRNAVDHHIRSALISAFTKADDDADCAAILFGGVDHVFSAGGDLPSMVGISEPQARERMQHGHQLVRLLGQLKVPLVSAAEGFAAGAVVGLALLGDHIVVGKDTRILFPFLKIGLIPDWGLLHTLPARVGVATARRLFTRGQAVSGEEAVRIGLADQDVGEGDVMAEALEQAVRLSKLSPRASFRMRQRLMSPAANLNDALLREETDQAEMLTGPDFKEGYAAFTEKREPDFLKPEKKTS